MPEQMTEEQLKDLQERLKNMSPEELKEFQKQQCIFCKITNKDVASKKIYEDEHCIAILDINPANPGHVLLMPKEHYAIMPLIPDEEIGHLSMVAKALSHVMLNVLKAEGINIFIANGIAAGQRAQHFMIHIIPRKAEDKLPMDIPENEISKDRSVEIRNKTIAKVEELFKLKKRTISVAAEQKPEKITVEKKPVKKKVVKKKPAKEEGASLDDIAKLVK